MSSNSLCKGCGKYFSRYQHLRKHVKKFHKSREEELAPEYRFICEYCGVKFNNGHNFQRHLKEHRLSIPKAPKIKTTASKLKSKQRSCPLCVFQTKATRDFIEHFLMEHEINIEHEIHDFNNANDFLEWKKNMEKTTKSKYLKNQKRVGKDHTFEIYSCHRTSYFNINHHRKRYSGKINGFCPAAITVIIKSDETHHVDFLRTHVGHKQDTEPLILTDTERKLIATKIVANVPYLTILNEIKSDERLGRLTKKDLHNIRKSIGLLHTKDVKINNTEAWITETAVSSSVLFFKKQDIVDEQQSYLRREDFVLIIMTNEQSEILVKFGTKCICFDRTHSLQNENLELISLLVIDEQTQAFPCAFLVSNRSDQEVLILFLSCIREKVGLLKPEIFMSDVADEFYDAWIMAMFPPASRLYSTWHVDYAWKSNLCRINTKEKQKAVYKKLKALVRETSELTFSKMLVDFQNQLNNDADSYLFSEYFNKYFMNKTKYWAYCYRTYPDLSTNMHLKSTHKVLKDIFLQKKYYSRFHKAMQAIMSYVQDELLCLNGAKISDKLAAKDSQLQLNLNILESPNDSNEDYDENMEDIRTVLSDFQDFEQSSSTEFTCGVNGIDLVLEDSNPADINTSQILFKDKVNAVKLKFSEMLESARSFEDLAAIENALVQLQSVVTRPNIIETGIHYVVREHDYVFQL